ncbi:MULTISPECIES: BREX-1 system phosphatase PglZ type B [Deefgea]|uniref:BREX-1 system phosphatase PglZ type B n=1 Tax=Deefgea chitinilytica TaxID=570276 RepID=A0ABS2CAZ6_9NEIS|nr:MULTISPECIES: BREX-1 system phosphatase PglZ type B [Deefgea]MBM5570546.1 BREX-1 system phosphatase PglZ type B [Deefgea chitinilytica]MBM9887775.1 BREX-1 system phosphatase PglZ type B [Deefgea sp. CFH1-16]
MTTILSKLVEALVSAARFHKGVQIAPAAVLWTDKDEQWRAAIPALRAAGLPLFTLGDYQPALGQGPAIWLKCVIAGSLPEFQFNGVPVIYLPGVSRSELRAVESCSRELQPLAELQYRGVYWSQASAKDWTINAFLCSSNGGLGLTVAQDSATQDALLRALRAGELLDRRLADLQGRTLDTGFFDGLMVPDQTRDLLVWMNRSQESKREWGEGRWAVFSKHCKQDFAFDPDGDGELTAAERLASGHPAWEPVWALFTDAHARYPRVAELLGRLQPSGDLFADRSRYPAANIKEENDLRDSLQGLSNKPQQEARQVIETCESTHGIRRHWLWGELGQSPLACALENLAQLCKLIGEPFGGTTIDAMADAYRQRFWQVDDLALRAMAAVRTSADQEAVQAALKAIYVPWLEDTNQRFQTLVRQAHGFAGGVVREPQAANYSASECYVFVDGLRFDVAQRLKQMLLDQAFSVQMDSAWTTVPSVTASGKTWVSPVAHLLKGTPDDKEFEPIVSADGRMASTTNLRKVLQEQQWQVLSESEIGTATGCAWTESGNLDHYGHAHGLRLARDIDDQLKSIAERITELFDAGWQKIRVVTDHGWLLVPGGLPKVELDKSQTETRWGRCAVLKDSSKATLLTLPWDWCAQTMIAMAPGIGSFIAGREYEHGGISLQESLIPQLSVINPNAKAAAMSAVKINSVKWTGLRCRIEVSGAPADALVDLRTKPQDAASSLSSSKALDASGKASLVVADDELEGAAAVIVVLSTSGELLQKQTTTIGE